MTSPRGERITVRNLLDSKDRKRILERIGRLDRDHPPLWGRMDAPRMVAHLCDQMRLTLDGVEVAPVQSYARYPVVRELLLYLLPWPKGKVKGPPEAFASEPGGWEQGLKDLAELIERFAREEPRASYPDHPFFGPMNRREWGVLCYRHTDHHLRQFGV